MNIRSLLLGTAAVALMGSSAFAADLYAPKSPQPIVESAGFSWDGLYIGAIGGGYFEDGFDTQGLIGGVVGANVVVSSPLVLGAEVQANYYFENDDYDAATELLALAKIGVLVSDNAMIYATAGVGYVWTDGRSFSELVAGVGAELAITESVSLRADLLGVHYEGDSGFSAARATVGVFFHF